MHNRDLIENKVEKNIKNSTIFSKCIMYSSSILNHNLMLIGFHYLFMIFNLSIISNYRHLSNKILINNKTTFIDYLIIK